MEATDDDNNYGEKVIGVVYLIRSYRYPQQFLTQFHVISADFSAKESAIVAP